MTPQTLDHAGIAARVPHSGTMCLLHTLERWTTDGIHCTAINHRAADHPLRWAGSLAAVNAVEYASQAMALHGSLSAAPGAAPTPGYLASVRGLRHHVARLDDLPGLLHVHAQKLAGDTQQALYAFQLQDEQGRLLVEGRATVVLNVAAFVA